MLGHRKPSFNRLASQHKLVLINSNLGDVQLSMYHAIFFLWYFLHHAS